MKRPSFKWKTDDPDIRGSLPALIRASKKARAISKATGTGFYVWRDGRVVNLNATKKKSRKKA